MIPWRVKPGVRAGRPRSQGCALSPPGSSVGVYHTAAAGCQPFLSFVVGLDFCRPLFKLLRFGNPFGRTIELSQVSEGRRHIGMVGTQGLLADSQRTLGERFRLGVLTLVSIEKNQDVQARRHSEVVWSEALLGKLERLFRNHNGMVIFASLKKLCGLLVELPQLSACALGVGYCASQAQHGSQSHYLYPFDHRRSIFRWRMASGEMNRLPPLPVVRTQPAFAERGTGLTG